MKLFSLVLASGLASLVCLGSAESQADAHRVLRGTYLKFFLYPNDFEKRDFREAEEAILELDPEAPFPELINCIREYIEGDYPSALFLLSEAEGKLGESKKYDVEGNSSTSQSFSMAAHFSFRKFQVLSKMGRREEACRERGHFIKKQLFFRLGMKRNWSISEYFSLASTQVRDLCIMGRFEDARTLTKELSERISLYEDDRGKAYLFLCESHLLYFESRKPEEKLRFLETKLKEIDDNGLIKMEMAWLGTLLGKEDEFSIGFFSELAQRSSKKTTRLYPWELGKIAFAKGQWKEALSQFEKAWNHIDQKNRPYRQIASRKLRKTIAQVLVEWGYPYRALGVVDRILKSPPRWSGTGDGLERWMNELYLTGILAIEDCHIMESYFDEDFLVSGSNNVSLDRSESTGSISLNEWLRQGSVARYGRKFLWEQAVRSNVAKDLARKDIGFVRDAFHLSGSRPWLWHVFVKVMGPRRMEMLLEEFPLVGLRGELYGDFARAEIAYLREDWLAVKKHALAARQNLPEAKIFLKIRMGGLLLKACNELDIDPPEVGIEKAIRELHPLLMQRLELGLGLQGKAHKEEVLSLFRNPSISAKDTDFLLGTKKRTPRTNP